MIIPLHAVRNGGDEKMNLVQADQRNDQRYITQDVQPREDLDSSQTDCLQTSG